MSFAPVLRSFLVAFRIHQHSLKSLNSLTHFRMQILLNSVQVEVHVVAEGGEEHQRLLYFFLHVHIVGQLYKKTKCASD